MPQLTTRLPHDLEEKRVQVARAHNRRMAIGLVAGLFVIGLCFRAVIVHTRGVGWLVAAYACALAWVFLSMRVVSLMDYRQCRDIDLICPKCRKELYFVLGRETGSSLLMKGICPRCKTDLNTRI